MGGPIFLLLMLAAGWLLLVRPQQQRLRAQRELIASLAVGERVVTAGGIVGAIVRLTERDAEIEVAPGIILTFLRPAISRRLGDDETDTPAGLGGAASGGAAGTAGTAGPAGPADDDTQEQEGA